MKFIPLQMIFSPGSTLEPEYLAPRLSIRFALSLYVCFLFLDIFLVHHIAGKMPGGNPMLWALDGALYEFQFLRNILGDPSIGAFWQSPFFWFSILWKSSADFLLIFCPAFYALKTLNAPREHLRVWVIGYLYLLIGCDIFLVLGMAPWLGYELGILAIDAQIAAVTTHLIEIWVAGLNLILFGELYRRAFSLSFQGAYVGWFALNIVVPVSMCVLAFLVLA